MTRGSGAGRNRQGLRVRCGAADSPDAPACTSGPAGRANRSPGFPGAVLVVARSATTIPAARDVRGNGLKTHH